MVVRVLPMVRRLIAAAKPIVPKMVRAIQPGLLVSFTAAAPWIGGASELSLWDMTIPSPRAKWIAWEDGRFREVPFTVFALYGSEVLRKPWSSVPDSLLSWECIARGQRSACFINELPVLSRQPDFTTVVGSLAIASDIKPGDETGADSEDPRDDRPCVQGEPRQHDTRGEHHRSDGQPGIELLRHLMAHFPKGIGALTF